MCSYGSCSFCSGGVNASLSNLKEKVSIQKPRIEIQTISGFDIMPKLGAVTDGQYPWHSISNGTNYTMHLLETLSLEGFRSIKQLFDLTLDRIAMLIGAIRSGQSI